MLQQQIQPKTLHIAHQSELLELKKEIADLKMMLSEMNKQKYVRSIAASGVKKIAIPTSDGVSLIASDEIIYAKAEGNYTKLFTLKKCYLISKTLKYVQKSIQHTDFVRCHQSYLINKQMVDQVQRQTLIMNSGITIPISRRLKKQVLQNF